MARIRTVKPDAWQDPRVGRLSTDARLLWVVLITMADDDGRFMALPAVIFGHGYPHDPDALQRIPGLLDELAACGLLTVYEVDGVAYGQHPKWSDHQKINRYTASKLPAPNEGSLRTHGGLTEPSRPEGKGREGSEERRGVPPRGHETVDAAPDVVPSPTVTDAVAVDRTLNPAIKEALRAAGFDPWEIDQAQGPIEHACRELGVPSDVDWFRVGTQLRQDRESDRCKARTPAAAFKFACKGLAGLPRLGQPGKGPQRACPIEEGWAQVQRLEALEAEGRAA